LFLESIDAMHSDLKSLARHASRVDRTTVPVWLGVALVAAVWLVARPYVGLRHDGVIYLGQALRHLDPQTMGRDLFFVFGSQDSFTIFGRVLAALYRHWDIAAIQVLVLVACQAAMFIAIYNLLRPIENETARWTGLVAIAAMSHVYGGYGLLSFGERFVTARSPAEPILLIALVLLIQSRTTAAIAAMAVAGLLHPLMTFPVAVIAWLVLCGRDRRWGWAALTMLAPVVLAMAGVGPFDGLLHRYDDNWWRLVASANGMVFLRQWQPQDWQTVAFDIALLALAVRWLPRTLAPVLAATALATALLFAASYVGADLMRNVLITQLQVWRVMWITHVLALACLPALLWSAWKRPGLGPLFAFSLAAAAVAVNGRWASGWVFILWAAGIWSLLAAKPKLSPSIVYTALWATGLALAGLSVAIMLGNARALATAANVQISDLNALNWLLVVSTMPSLVLPAAALALRAWEGAGLGAFVSAILVFLALALGTFTWDQRTSWTRYIETGLDVSHPFSAYIPRTAQVYWQDDVAATWVLLRRASYLSPEQGAGILFSRPTALEIERREKIFEPLRMQRDICQAMAALQGEGEPRQRSECWPTEAVAEHICRAHAGPDFLIFERRLSKGLVAEWTFDAGRAGEGNRSFYLYDCLKLR
jgi:hypothetical protein